MADVHYGEETSAVPSKPPSEDLKYRYSPVPSDCMACAVRPKSRKCKELEAQSDIVRGPFPSMEDICCLRETLSREKNSNGKAQLHVVTTNQRIRVFGKWSEDKLLTVVTDRLLQRANSAPKQSYEKIPKVEIKQISNAVRYDPIIHRGIYSEDVLRRLYHSGASESVLIRAMKFGLKHLKPEDLNYFIQFGVSIEVLRSRKLWKELIDEDSLTISLRTMGFDEKSSRKIIQTGMLSQNEICLMQMMLAGVDVPGILNWQGPTIEVGIRMTQFLRKLGVKEDALQLVVQKGVDEETNEMLKDLGFIETEEEEHLGMHEIVICECDLTIFESQVSSVLSKTYHTNNSKTLVPEFEYSEENTEAEEPCACFSSRSSSIRSSSRSSEESLVTCEGIKSEENSLTSSELLVDRIEYLRRTVMIPLTWAMAKALKYRPSDPKYYIACQLVRWRHGTVSKAEIKETEEFVIARNIQMDKKLMEQKLKDEEKLIAEREDEILRNIPCHPCSEREQIHRVKERCWKCVKKWVPNYESCEFPEICSCCKVNLSDIINSDTSTPSMSDGNISNPLKIEKSNSKNRSKSSGSLSYRNSYTENMESSNFHRDYDICEESFDPVSRGDDTDRSLTSTESDD